ncbi:MAG: SMEK domain-containing protein [bacterium]
MDVAPVGRDYNTINNALSTLITSPLMDSAGNLQNKNILMEGFYREFLNILYGWKLVNANAERQNMPKIVAQVSATCDHGKIQDSLDGFEPPEDGEWHFVFIPITTNAPKLRAGFNLPARVAFDYKCHILDAARLMRMVQHAGAEKQFLLAQFVSLKKVFLWKRLNELLSPDELDKQLYPHVKDAPALLDAYGKNAEGEVCPIWEIIRASWREAENHPIVIEGAGGIGKTVALFSIVDAEDRYCPAPPVYIPMHRLVTQDGQCVNLSQYIREQSDTYGQKVVELAEKPWDGGPQLLVLLDGFNEVPALKQREILNMLNGWRRSHPGAQLHRLRIHIALYRVSHGAGAPLYP